MEYETTKKDLENKLWKLNSTNKESLIFTTDKSILYKKTLIFYYVVINTFEIKILYL